MLARTTLALSVLLGTGLLGSSGQAQTNPSADSIIKSLTPTESMGNSTRGIRIGNAPTGQPAERTTGQPTAASAPQRTTRSTAVSLNIPFATGSADLTPRAVHALDELGRALGSPTLAAYHFRIEGHTDTVGTADLNKSLSQRRAETVVSYLTSKYQIDPARLQAIGMGEDGLLVATPANTPEARNRRVLVVNVGS